MLKKYNLKHAMDADWLVRLLEAKDEALGRQNLMHHEVAFYTFTQICTTILADITLCKNILVK